MTPTEIGTEVNADTEPECPECNLPELTVAGCENCGWKDEA